MAKKPDWSALRHHFTDERERLQAMLPDGWRCDLSLASYSHGSVPTYGVTLEHDEENIRVYGSGVDPSSALAEAREKVLAEYKRRGAAPRLAKAEPVAILAKRRATA